MVKATALYSRVLPKSTFSHQAYEDLEYMEYYVRKVRDQFSLLKSGGVEMSDLCTHRSGVFQPYRRVACRRVTNVCRRVLHHSPAN